MKGGKISFYVGCVLAILSMFATIFYIIAYKGDKEFNTAVFLLTGLGGIACVVLSFLNLSNIGAAILGVCDFFGMLLFLRIYYPVVIDSDIMSGKITITPDIANLIVITAVLLVISITANVLAWQKNDSSNNNTKRIGIRRRLR